MRYLIAILVLSLGRLVDAQPRAQPAAPAFENTPRQFDDEKVIEPWATFISVDGQAEPIPQAWLTDDEARIAHSLKLPEAVPKTVPYDFPFFGVSGGQKAVPRGAMSYFTHLCTTEAGTWIFRTVDNVEGLYVARPQSKWTAMESILHTYGVENPWIQRTFALTADDARWQGGWFISPPLYNFLFAEQPRRNVSWQATITEPYIRLFGYTTEEISIPTTNAPNRRDRRDKTPMQVIGIDKPTAQYAFTWRGIKRTRDREHNIAGGEVLIYDRVTLEVLAVKRQFVVARANNQHPHRMHWEVGAICPKVSGYNQVGAEFSQFVFDVLKTVAPSTTGFKQ